jgi:hypothetical protein
MNEITSAGRVENLMSESLAQIVELFFNREGYSFRRKGSDFQFVASSGGRKWKMLILCEKQVLTCISVFPWQLSAPIHSNALWKIEEWNTEQREGCFLISRESSIVTYRLAVPILDAFCANDYIKHLLTLSAAVVGAYWENVFRLAKLKSD